MWSAMADSNNDSNGGSQHIHTRPGATNSSLPRLPNSQARGRRAKCACGAARATGFADGDATPKLSHSGRVSYSMWVVDSPHSSYSADSKASAPDS